MKLTGIIAEYNPFHNGHQFHMEQALKLTGADAAVVVMSGDFVQRGTPAMMPKHLRAAMALQNGAAAVFELPVCYACSSAESFAYGAISLLDKLGCVESICFGSECGDIDVLQKYADILWDEPKAYQNYLNQYLKNGNAFPAARQLALQDYLQLDADENLLCEPNNILGIEYLKALKKCNSQMKPYTIQRVASHYHDTSLQDKYSSASAIRNVIAQDNLSELQSQLSSNSMQLLIDNHHKRFPVYANDFSLLLKYKLLQEDKCSLLEYLDVSESIANRIINTRNQLIDFEQFCEVLKTKDVTYTRIARALLHILLGIKQTDIQTINYARLLGFRKDCTEILTILKESTTIPLITKLTATDALSDIAKTMLDLDIQASNLYESVVTDKYKTSFQSEYQKQIVKI